jgi:hypothetical protein
MKQVRITKTRNKTSGIAAITYTIVFVLMMPVLSNAQPPPLQWEKRYGGSGTDGLNAIAQTIDGGYITAGVFRQNAPAIQHDYWIQKANAGGNVVWSKTFGGTGQDRANTVTQTSDGGYILGGDASSGNGDIAGNHGMSDAWILKLDSTGNVFWKKCYGGSMWDRCSKIIPLPDNSVMVLGMTSSDDGNLAGVNTVGFWGESNIWLMKLDAAGNILWQKTYGGLGYDDGYDIIAMPDGGFALSGTEATPTGMYDMWVCRIDSIGTIIWEKTFGYGDYEYAYSLTLTEKSDLLVAGYTLSTDFPGFKGGPSDAVLAKVNGTTGALIWEKTLGGNSSDRITGITRYNDLFVLAGTSNSNDGDISSPLGSWDVWLTAVDDSGNVLWNKNFGGSSEDGNSYNIDIITTSDSSLVIAGMIGSAELSGGGGLWDGYIFKLRESKPTGIAHPLHQFNYLIYPNPAKATITIQVSEPGKHTFRLTDISGKVLQSGSFSGVLKTINISNRPVGTYLMQLQNDRKQIMIRKVVKE